MICEIRKLGGLDYAQLWSLMARRNYNLGNRLETCGSLRGFYGGGETFAE